MLASLDFLGAFKWPSVLAISALPVLSYFASWGNWDEGLGAALYGPELVAGVPLVLSHRAHADPLRDDTVTWAVRGCQTCATTLRRVRLAYAGCDAPPLQWSDAQGPAGRAQVELRRAELRQPPALCLWIDAEASDGKHEQRRWPLAGPIPMTKPQH
jgi:hypothetical protein